MGFVDGLWEQRGGQEPEFSNFEGVGFLGGLQGTGGGQETEFRNLDGVA